MSIPPLELCRTILPLARRARRAHLAGLYLSRLRLLPAGFLRRRRDAAIAELLRNGERLPPIPLEPSGSELEVHTMLHVRDLSYALWSLYSFLHHSGLRCAVVVHADGPWTDRESENLTRAFPGITLLSRTTRDAQIAQVLARYPACLAYRALGVFGPKLFDPYFFRTRPHVILVDSDVLFFRPPTELLDRTRYRSAHLRYNVEAGTGYRTRPMLMERFPVTEPNLNAGLVAATPDESWLRRLEAVLPALQEIAQADRLRPGEDQTALAVVARDAGWAPLPSEYSSNPEQFRRARSSIVSMHFHSWAKDLFAMEGIPHFIQAATAAVP